MVMQIARCLCDGNGRFVDGDGGDVGDWPITCSRGRAATRRVVGTVMSNVGLEIALRSRGLQLRAYGRGRQVCAR